MNQSFQYSVLKYRPSYLLDERVNIGLLFQFEEKVNYEEGIEDEKRLFFIYPNHLKRISDFFPNIGKGKNNLVDLKRYLREFYEKTEEITWKSDIQKLTLKEIIPSEFIINDANSFFFSDVKQGFYTSIEETINYYKRVYFKFYEKNDYANKDLAVKKYFYDFLIKFSKPNDERLHYFKEGITIKNKIGNSRFEYHWQNGTPNLVKTLGLDLKDEQGIQRKVFNWTLAIDYIEQMNEYKDYNFDILVSRPKSRSLFKSYDNALDVLSDIKAEKKIIEQDEIKDYAEKALSTVKPFGV